MAKEKKDPTEVEVPINEFAAFYISDAADPLVGKYAVGVHGYISTQVIAKRGYGLKRIIPTQSGYSNTTDEQLRVIRSVVDIRIPLYKDNETVTTANTLLAGCNAVMEFILQLEEIPKSVCLLVPRKNLAVFLTKGYKKCIEAGYKDTKGNEIPFKEQLDVFARNAALLADKEVRLLVEHAPQDVCMGYQEAVTNATDALIASIKHRKVEADPACDVSEPEGYWNHDHGRHPLLGKSRLVFRMLDGKVVEQDHLYLMDFDKTSKKKEHLHKLEIEVGQLLPSASYSVVKIKDVDPILKEVTEEHSKYLNVKFERLAVVFLDAVFKPGAHSVMSKVGTSYLYSKSVVTDLVDGYGSMFTHELNPARQAHRAWNTYLTMQATLKDFMARLGKVTEEHSKDLDEGETLSFHNFEGLFTATNITSRFMKAEEDAKGKLTYKASKEIETPNTSLLVEATFVDDEAGGVIKTAKINLSIGIDTPKRNAVASMANANLKVYVLVRQDTNFTVRHCIVVTNGDEYGMWAAPFANRTFVNK